MTRHPHTFPFFYLQTDRTLTLTVDPGELSVCTECPNLHIRVVADATPALIRELARGLGDLATALERAK